MNTNPIAPITGYLTPSQIEIYLNLFKDKKYLEIKSQEDFKKFISEFKPEFKSQRFLLAFSMYTYNALDIEGILFNGA